MAKAPPCPNSTLTNSVCLNKARRPTRTKKASGSLRKTGAGGVSPSRKRIRVLTYPEDSEDLKVGVTELQEQLRISEEAGISIKQVAQEAMNESGQKIYDNLGKEKKMYSLPAGPDGTRS